METIRTYLDNLFLQLPDTPEVRRAKEELFGMMEDKYYELKSQGKSENEAIGMVIADFGSLDEVIRDLNLGEEIQDRGESAGGGEESGCGAGLFISMDEVQGYLAEAGKNARMIAIGVMLCVWSPVALIILGGFGERFGSPTMENILSFAGIAVLFLFIAVAVGLFIVYGTRISKYDWMKKETIRMDVQTEVMVRREREQQKASFVAQMVAGVTLCIIGVLAVIASGVFYESDEFMGCVFVGIMLFLVGIAVLLFVIGGMGDERYKILLQEEEFSASKKEKKKKSKKTLDRISSIYWCLVTAVYLGWSFWTMHWGRTWIIWPVAGVLWAVVEELVKAVNGE
ncbi:MAG: permease prefix domain 1-containing protein [Candidatus Limivivens sp.]|nr:permease prefix domain 1-containing protein [Candidatus Limivivens sp.]